MAMRRNAVPPGSAMIILFLYIPVIEWNYSIRCLQTCIHQFFFFVICIHKNQCCLCCFLIYSFYSFIFILLQESIDVSFQCLTTMYGVDIRLAHITQRTTTTINDASPHQVLRTTTAPSTWKIGLAEKYTC